MKMNRQVKTILTIYITTFFIMMMLISYVIPYSMKAFRMICCMVLLYSITALDYVINDGFKKYVVAELILDCGITLGLLLNPHFISPNDMCISYLSFLMIFTSYRALKRAHVIHMPWYKKSLPKVYETDHL